MVVAPLRVRPDAASERTEARRLACRECGLASWGRPLLGAQNGGALCVLVGGAGGFGWAPAAWQLGGLAALGQACARKSLAPQASSARSQREPALAGLQYLIGADTGLAAPRLEGKHSIGGEPGATVWKLTRARAASAPARPAPDRAGLIRLEHAVERWCHLLIDAVVFGRAHCARALCRIWMARRRLARCESCDARLMLVVRGGALQTPTGGARPSTRRGENVCPDVWPDERRARGPRSCSFDLMCPFGLAVGPGGRDSRAQQVALLGACQAAR